MLFVVVAFALGLTGDPAGEGPPPALVPVAPVAAARPSVVVVDLASLGVLEETAKLASALVVARLREQLKTHDVRAGSELAAPERAQAAACGLPSCWKEVAKNAGAAFVVHGTVGKLGNGLVVTLDVVERAHVVEQTTDPELITPMIHRAVDALVIKLGSPGTAAQAPRATLPPAATTTPTTKAPGVPGAAANDDLILLAINYGLMFIPVVGSPFILPLAQGLAAKEGGPGLVHNDYPNWWWGTLAGYGVFAGGGAVGVGLYVFAVISLGSGVNPEIGLVMLFAALGVGVATLLAEPAVVWFASRAESTGRPQDLDAKAKVAVAAGLTPAALLGFGPDRRWTSSSSSPPPAWSLVSD
ncbi:MAG: hypothetical protein Q8O67_26680 [Deltaproteobacteria bacterium]|nr:hypothetical protein [Deltaproteobacteria bacterium]